jgi:hypothetical protein
MISQKWFASQSFFFSFPSLDLFHRSGLASATLSALQSGAKADCGVKLAKRMLRKVSFSFQWNQNLEMKSWNEIVKWNRATLQSGVKATN